MTKKRVLYISQEIKPFLPETPISKTSRELPQKIQEAGKEIRVFMPRYGCINERRHQLHEVIRLSGMNLIIDDTDHPLIIKVASIPAAKMQVYFIDNEEFFKRKTTLEDKNGKFYEDNDERALFFCRGALETVKKLGWVPDVIHCHGWMTSFVPLLAKKYFAEDPHFADSKIVFSAYDCENEKFEADIQGKVAKEDGISKKDLDLVKEKDLNSLYKLGIQYADAVVQGSETLPKDMLDFVKKTEKPFLAYQNGDDFVKAYNKFYDTMIEENTVMA